VIRRATGSDHLWISNTAAAVYLELGDYGSIIPSWLAHPGVLTYVEDHHNEEASEPRGFILLGFYEPPGVSEGAHVADLLAIAVAPAHQRRGVGRRLLDHAIYMARLASRTNEIPEMRLTVADTNKVGQRLFQSTGFDILNENHGSYDGGQRAIRMSRSLP
jgi:ribosomal protein S18 acetylase RimI-like enzyme